MKKETEKEQNRKERKNTWRPRRRPRGFCAVAHTATLCHTVTVRIGVCVYAGMYVRARMHIQYVHAADVRTHQCTLMRVLVCVCVFDPPRAWPRRSKIVCKEQINTAPLQMIQTYSGHPFNNAIIMCKTESYHAANATKTHNNQLHIIAAHW